MSMWTAVGTLNGLGCKERDLGFHGGNNTHTTFPPYEQLSSFSCAVGVSSV